VGRKLARSSVTEAAVRSCTSNVSAVQVSRAFASLAVLTAFGAVSGRLDRLAEGTGRTLLREGSWKPSGVLLESRFFNPRSEPLCHPKEPRVFLFIFLFVSVALLPDRHHRNLASSSRLVCVDSQ